MGILHELGGRRRLLQHPIAQYAARRAVRLGLANWSSVSGAFEGKFPVHLCGASFEYVLGPGDTVGEVLYWSGTRALEPEILPVFAALARTGRGVLDIGANSGLYSLLACAANPNAAVIAWEPVEYLADRIRLSVAANGFGARCTVRTAAAAEVDGTAEFFLSDDTTMSSLSESFATWDGHHARRSKVTTERVDSVVSREFPVDLVKIDVEGHEDEVLQGAQEMIARWRPSIIFEVLRGVAPFPLNAFFGRRGYRLSIIEAGGPRGVDAIVSLPVAKNYLAVPA